MAAAHEGRRAGKQQDRGEDGAARLENRIRVSGVAEDHGAPVVNFKLSVDFSKPLVKSPATQKWFI